MKFRRDQAPNPIELLAVAIAIFSIFVTFATLGYLAVMAIRYTL